MPPIVECLDLPADTLALAARFGGEPDLAVLWNASGGGASWIACRALATTDALDPEPSLAFSGAGDAVARAPRWIGAVPYEALRGLERRAYRPDCDPRPAPALSSPIWKRYGAVFEVTDRVRVVGDDVASVRSMIERARTVAAGPSRGFGLSLRSVRDSAELHARRIRRALELIARGDLYEVNLSRMLRFDVRGDNLALLAALGERTRASFSGLLRLGAADVVTSSPELCLEVGSRGEVRTCPIKGTRPRGATPALDRALVAELDADPKERAELTMVIDVERNDLGRIARWGSVRVNEPPHVETHPTLHHRVAAVSGVAREGVDRATLFEAMLPSGSVTGAPKVRAMEVIADLEAMRRGVYTGAFGFIGHDGGVRLGMAIRTLTIRDGVADYPVGGGIVADSNPEREVEETLWKARHVLDLAR